MGSKAKCLLCLLMTLLILVGCGAQGTLDNPTTAPDSSGAALDSQELSKTEQALAEIVKLGTSPDDNYRVWYEIFVYSYCDSNGDGIGDFNGLTSKLDELETLGVNGIWLMPIHPSVSYHKYNVSDYYAIDPAYGTMEDFENFIAECEKRDIHVIIDLVVNHSGSEHPWFKEAVSYLRTLPAGARPDPTECKYVDYYNFVQAEHAPAGYRSVTGASGWFYEGRFTHEMPDLNLMSDAVRAEIKDIMSFWLDKGVAGFRLDAAKEFYTGDNVRNIEVLRWIQETAVSLKPDCYLVAEVWDTQATITSLYTSGIISIFNFPFGDNEGRIVKTLQGAGRETAVSKYATSLEKSHATFKEANPNYIDAPFMTNHDVGRVAGFVGRIPEKTKMAGAMNIFMSGSVFIYYGEEIGMITGAMDDPSYRAPMYWNAARDNGTTQPPPGCTLPKEYPFGSLDEQREDDASIYNYYRQAVAIRQALPVISHGDTTCETALNVGCISAQRKTWNDEQCIILMNVDKVAAEVDLSAYSDWHVAAKLSADGNEITMEGNVLSMPAFGIVVLLPNG